MNSIANIILTGFFVRADGWGGDGRWKKISDFFNAFSCSGLFAIMSVFYAPPMVALVCGIAFLVWRLPGFHGWQNWYNMFWRGFWTSFIGFLLVSLVAHGNPYGALLSVPFSAIYMTIYAGGYKWLEPKVHGFDRHVWIEHASGWAFGAAILMILGA